MWIRRRTWTAAGISGRGCDPDQRRRHRGGRFCRRPGGLVGHQHPRRRADAVPGSLHLWHSRRRPQLADAGRVRPTWGLALWGGGLGTPPTCMPAGPCLLAVTLMFSSGPAPRPGNVIYKRMDSAGPWHDPVTAPAGSPTAPVGAFFLNADNRWALGAGGLSSTTDAGRSWSVLSLQLPESVAGLYGIVIKSPRVAWAFGYRLSGQPSVSRDSPAQRILLRTSTAGVRWSEVQLPSLDR